jgi:hypothetical protein
MGAVGDALAGAADPPYPATRLGAVPGIGPDRHREVDSDADRKRDATPTHSFRKDLVAAGRISIDQGFPPAS